MNIENTQAQMRKGILEFCILSIIGNDEECYASEILDRMKRAKLKGYKLNFAKYVNAIMEFLTNC